MKTHRFTSRFESNDSRALRVSVRYGNTDNAKGYRPAIVSVQDGVKTYRQTCLLSARQSGFFLTTPCQAGKRAIRAGIIVYAKGNPAYFVDMSGNGFDGSSIHLQTLARDYPFQIG